MDAPETQIEEVDLPNAARKSFAAGAGPSLLLQISCRETVILHFSFRCVTFDYPRARQRFASFKSFLFMVSHSHDDTEFPFPLTPSSHYDLVSKN